MFIIKVKVKINPKSNHEGTLALGNSKHALKVKIYIATEELHVCMQIESKCFLYIQLRKELYIRFRLCIKIILISAFMYFVSTYML